MNGTVFRKVREVVINGAAFVLIRAAAAVYYGTMFVLATWSVVHSILLPPPRYA